MFCNNGLKSSLYSYHPKPKGIYSDCDMCSKLLESIPDYYVIRLSFPFDGFFYEKKGATIRTTDFALLARAFAHYNKAYATALSISDLCRSNKIPSTIKIISVHKKDLVPPRTFKQILVITRTHPVSGKKLFYSGGILNLNPKWSKQLSDAFQFKPSYIKEFHDALRSLENDSSIQIEEHLIKL